MNNITLKQCCELIKMINESEDYEAFFSNGKLAIQSKIITIGGN